jgi:glutathione S-transferase
VTYQYESPPDSPSAEASACIKANSQWVEKVYQVQPAAVEAADAAFEAAMPVLVACLREQGFLDEEDPTADEVRAAIWSVFDYVEEFPGSGVDPTTCPQKAGITDF